MCDGHLRCLVNVPPCMTHSSPLYCSPGEHKKHSWHISPSIAKQTNTRPLGRGCTSLLFECWYWAFTHKSPASLPVLWTGSEEFAHVFDQVQVMPCTWKIWYILAITQIRYQVALPGHYQHPACPIGGWWYDITCYSYSPLIFILQ